MSLFEMVSVILVSLAFASLVAVVVYWAWIELREEGGDD